MINLGDKCLRDGDCETWITALRIQSSGTLYDLALGIIRAYPDIYQAADALKKSFSDMAKHSMPASGVFTELLWCALARVDWLSIVTAISEANGIEHSQGA